MLGSVTTLKETPHSEPSLGPWEATSSDEEIAWEMAKGTAFVPPMRVSDQREIPFTSLLGRPLVAVASIFLPWARVLARALVQDVRAPKISSILQGRGRAWQSRLGRYRVKREL